MLEALEVLVTILCFCPCARTHTSPPPPTSVGLQSTLSSLNPQVTMEEEDESRGKTEESGEDRGDGPPDRDPTLSPTAFILVRPEPPGATGGRG